MSGNLIGVSGVIKDGWLVFPQSAGGRQYEIKIRCLQGETPLPNTFSEQTIQSVQKIIQENILEKGGLPSFQAAHLKFEGKCKTLLANLDGRVENVSEALRSSVETIHTLFTSSTTQMPPAHHVTTAPIPSAPPLSQYEISKMTVKDLKEHQRLDSPIFQAYKHLISQDQGGDPVIKEGLKKWIENQYRRFYLRFKDHPEDPDGLVSRYGSVENGLKTEAARWALSQVPIDVDITPYANILINMSF